MSHASGRFVWYDPLTPEVEADKFFCANGVGGGTKKSLRGVPAYILFTAQGASVSGLTGLPDAARQSGLRPTWLGYIGVDDVDAAAARIERLGGAVYVPPTDVTHIIRFSVSEDPPIAHIALYTFV